MQGTGCHRRADRVGPVLNQRWRGLEPRGPILLLRTALVRGPAAALGIFARREQCVDLRLPIPNRRLGAFLLSLARHLCGSHHHRGPGPHHLPCAGPQRLCALQPGGGRYAADAGGELRRDPPGVDTAATKFALQAAQHSCAEDPGAFCGSPPRHCFSGGRCAHTDRGRLCLPHGEHLLGGLHLRASLLLSRGRGQQQLYEMPGTGAEQYLPRCGSPGRRDHRLNLRRRTDEDGFEQHLQLPARLRVHLRAAHRGPFQHPNTGFHQRPQLQAHSQHLPQVWRGQGVRRRDHGHAACRGALAARARHVPHLLLGG
mmetsp:Transcript_29155/g.69451  ORF Transcript_29155/g.69451 Transcript_29155/m.69451 type:complete len:314 (-) Transcript_29155:7240-8181(-)